MNSNGWIAETLPLLEADVGLTIDVSASVTEMTEDWLINQMACALRHYLDLDMPGLLNLCYRLDLNEDKVNDLLMKEAPGQLGRQLAILVIAREKQKILTRRAYQP